MPFYVTAQTVIWQEIFSGDVGAGATIDAGATAWTIYPTGQPLKGTGSFDVQNSRFEGIDLMENDGGANYMVWESEAISIAGYESIIISFDVIVTLTGFEPDQDTIRATYEIDGGTEVEFYMEAGTPTAGTKSIGGLTGNTIIIRIYCRNTFTDEIHIFDNVTVAEPAPLYSRADGDWNNTNTWSYTQGGISCGCTPDSSFMVNIVDGYTVNMNVSDSAFGIDVDNGILLWTGSNTLDIFGGDVTNRATGNMDMNGQNAVLQFAENNSINQLVNDGIFTINDINLYNDGGSLNITGSADITVTNNFDLINSNITVTNNNTATLDIQHDLKLTGNTGTFTNNETIDVGNNFSLDGIDCNYNNNGPLNVTNDLNLKGNNSILTNSDAITVSDRIQFQESNCTVVNNGLIDVAFNLRAGTDKTGNVFTNNAAGTTTIGGDFSFRNTDVTISNYGIFNLDGVFINGEIDNGSFFYNYAGATWNYGGATYDPDVQLYCNYDANTFNYNGAGAQDIITPQDAYWHLTLSNSGIKESQANLDINGDLTISGTANFDIGTNSSDITVAGDWSNGGTFTEGTRNVTFDGNDSQTFTTGETFYDLTINNSGAGLTFSNGNVIVSNILGMIQGNIDAGTYRLTLGTGTGNVGTLSHTSGTVIGEFERWIDGPGLKLFPIGTSSNYCPAIIALQNIVTLGSLIGQFVSSDPLNAGLPLVDGGINVVNTFTEGYWSLTEDNSLNCDNYDLGLKASGFISYQLVAATRLLTRPNSSSDWIAEGSHVDAVGDTIKRTGINTLSAEYAAG
ncbi:MAG: hypothetical protein V3V53_15950, partial [Bacteroidales bacterium]